MAKKYILKALSVGLSLVMCAGMVTPAFAASFYDLNNAIGGKADGNENAFTAGDGTTRYGYGAGEGSSWEIEAWDEGDTRNVQLNAGVTYQGDQGDNEYINIGKNANVTLNLNGQTVDGGYNAETGDEGNRYHVFTVQSGATLEINGGENSGDTTKRGTITGGNSISGRDPVTNKLKYGYGGAIYVYGGGTLVVNNADLTGNHADTYGGAIEAVKGTVVRLNNTNVTGNTADYGGGISAEGELYVNGGSFIENAAETVGGAIHTTGATVELTKVVMNNNTAGENGGALRIASNSTATLDGITATGNTAGYHGGALNTYSSTVIMKNIIMTGNQAGMGSGGLYIGSTGTDTNVVFGDNVNISGNTKGDGTQSNIQIEIFDADGTTTPEERVPTLPELERYKGEYVGESNVYCEGGVSWMWSYVDPVVTTPDESDGTTPSTTPSGNGGRVPDSTTSTPVTEPEADATIGIEDEAVPLAGIFTRADAIGYLWEQAGRPEAELSDFPDVPEEHYWAVAIGWAQDMGIALPDEDGNFRPDDMVLRSVEDLEVDPEGELQEFLNRYAVFVGVELDDGELFIELDGAAGDVIMGEEAQEIFNLFFALLEEALADQAA